MHSVVNLPEDVLSRVKRRSRASTGWDSLTSSRKRRWKWTGIFSAMSGSARVLATSGAVKPLGRIDLVAVFHRVGDAGKDDGKVGLGFVLAGGGEQLLGEMDAAAGRAGGVELLENLVLIGDRDFAQDVALGFFRRHGDAGILGRVFFGGGPPFLKFILPNDLGKGQLQIDGRGRLVGIGGERLDDELDRFVFDQLLDFGRLGLLAHEQIFG